MTKNLTLCLWYPIMASDTKKLFGKIETFLKTIFKMFKELTIHLKLINKKLQ